MRDSDGDGDGDKVQQEQWEHVIQEKDKFKSREN